MILLTTKYIHICNNGYQIENQINHLDEYFNAFTLL
ncbi:MAG: hypothetical protein [Phage NV21]|nr:MAG: hypothetical protein [Phage NV21]